MPPRTRTRRTLSLRPRAVWRACAFLGRCVVRESLGARLSAAGAERTVAQCLVLGDEFAATHLVRAGARDCRAHDDPLGHLVASEVLLAVRGELGLIGRDSRPCDDEG